MFNQTSIKIEVLAHLNMSHIIVFFFVVKTGSKHWQRVQISKLFFYDEILSKQPQKITSSSNLYIFDKKHLLLCKLCFYMCLIISHALGESVSV